MGACCSAGARDRHDTTIMPPPQNQERPRTGLSKLQTLRYHVQSRASPKQPTTALSQTENEVPLLPNDNQRDENSNTNSPASTPSDKSPRSDGNANVTSSMNRFGFGFRKPNSGNANTTSDRASRDSGKGSVDSLDIKGKKQTSASSGHITPSSSTGSLNTKTLVDRKPLVLRNNGNSESKNDSAKSSTSSLNSQGSRPPSPGLTKSKSQPLKTPSFKTTGIGKPSVAQPKNISETPVTTAPVTSVTPTKAKPIFGVDSGLGQEEVGYRSSRLPAHARGPYLTRLQAQAAKSDPYTTSLPRSHKYQKNDQNNKLQQQQQQPKSTEHQFGFRTTAVPNQLPLSQRKSYDGSKSTPDSMTESIFNPEAPLATFDSLGSTSFMSQISMASDDMILDFDESETTPGFNSVASTPGDDKNVEREFVSGSLGRKPRSKSIEAPRKNKNLGKSPLVIDTTEKADDSAYVSGSSEKLELTLASNNYSGTPGALSPVLDVSTDTDGLDDVDKTLSSTSLDYKSLFKQSAVDVVDKTEEHGNAIMSETMVVENSMVVETDPSKGSSDEYPELRVRYRTRPRAATLQELSELIHETSPSKDPVLQRARSLSSPLKPPRPRSMSGLDEEEVVMVEAHVYRQTMQEITTLKTMLHKLKRCLYEEDAGLLELAEHRRGLRGSSFGSEGSLLDECPLKRKSSQRSNPETGNRSSDASPRDRTGSIGEVDFSEENYQLRQQVAALRRELEEKDHTIHLLQQQMTKYETEDRSYKYQTSSTQTELPSNGKTPAADAVPEQRSKLVKPSSLPQAKHGLQHSNSVSDIQEEISRKSSEKAREFHYKFVKMETPLVDLNGRLRKLVRKPTLNFGRSLASLLVHRSADD